MGRRTMAQIAEDEARMTRNDDVRRLRDASEIMDAYGVPASANVLRVVADAIEAGTRKRVPDGTG